MPRNSEPAAAVAETSPVEARVIHPHPDYAIDSIVTGAVAAQGIADGWADGAAAAVAYARSLASQPD